MAAERGLDFVVTDAVQWRADKNGTAGHNGTMTIGTLAAATSPGVRPSAPGPSLGSHGLHGPNVTVNDRRARWCGTRLSSGRPHLGE
jgi:hypothetical protein